MLTPYAVFAENNKISDIQIFSMNEDCNIEPFSVDLAITNEETEAIDYFVAEAKQRKDSINIEEYTITPLRFNELLNYYILLKYPELYIVDIENTSYSLSSDATKIITAINVSYHPEEEEELVSYLAEEMRKRTEVIKIASKYTITADRFSSLFHEISDSKLPYLNYLEKYYPELFYVNENISIDSDDNENVTSVSLSYNAPINAKETEMMGVIIEGLTNRLSEISVRAAEYGIDFDRFKYIINNCLSTLIQNEHPELFYVDTGKIFTGYNPNTKELIIYADGTYEFPKNDGTKDTFTANAYMPAGEIKTKQDLIDAEYEHIKSLIEESMTPVQKKSMTPVQKILIVHDYITANYEYDTTYESRTLDSMVEQKKGVCQGYSYLFKYVLNKLGIECVTVPSTACEHMWNKVKLGDEWYNVDVTHDDPILNSSANINHTHFLLNDVEIKNITDDNEHTSWNQYKWDGETKSEVSNSSTYRDLKVHGIQKQIICKNGTFYGFYKFDNKQGYSLSIIDLENNTITPDYEETADFTWQSGDSSYALSPTMVDYNGDIYFNSGNEIFKYDTENNKADVVYTYVPENDEDTNSHIYGLQVIDNTLYIEYTDDIIEKKGDKAFLKGCYDKLIPVHLKGDMPCSSEINKTDDNQILVTVNIPDEYKEKAAIYVAEYDINGVLTGMREVGVPFTPDSASTQIKAFIWGESNEPLATVKSRELNN